MRSNLHSQVRMELQCVIKFLLADHILYNQQRSSMTTRTHRNTTDSSRERGWRLRHLRSSGPLGRRRARRGCCGGLGHPADRLDIEGDPPIRWIWRATRLRRRPCPGACRARLWRTSGPSPATLLLRLPRGRPFHAGSGIGEAREG